MNLCEPLSQHAAQRLCSANAQRFQNVALGVCALAGTTLSAMMLRCGILATPDSWAYWEGSVSIIENGTFSFLCGEPIVWWPPLFSVWLAAFQVIGMTTGFWLIIAMCGLTFTNCLIWGGYGLVISRSNDGRVMWMPYIASLIFFAVFIPVCGTKLLAHFLLLQFVGLAFLCIVSTGAAVSDSKWLLNWICVGFSLSLALLAHNSAIVYITAVIPLIIVMKRRPWRVRLIALIAMLAMSMLPWFVYRIVSDSGSSHALSTQYLDPVRHFINSMAGLSDLMFTTDSVYWILRIVIGISMACGIAVLVILPVKAIGGSGVRNVSVTVLLSYVCLYGLFNLVHIADPFMDRFLWFIPLAIVPAVFRVAHSRKGLMTLAIVLCLSISVIRSVVMSVTAVTPCRCHDAIVKSKYILRYHWLLPNQQNTVRAGLERITPPTYPWQARWERTHNN